jgi:hypothetical protein
VKKLREHRQFINTVLFMKGLNQEAANEIELLKMGKILDRNLNNKNLRQNK